MKISVCMATYNGSKYIHQQLSSILPQLKASDELVIVDDASGDSTIEVIRAFSDPRITLISNEQNLGVLKAFEKALCCATGDLIFLSDQDDIWFDDKVQKITAAFEQSPEVTLVLSDATIIDGNGRELCESFFSKRGSFGPGLLPNIIRNKYLGCTMAFKREMLEHFLPFPPKIPMHDMWMGIVNDIYGKTYFIDEPLIRYRRHGKNASPAGSSLIQMTVWRWRLIRHLIPVAEKGWLRRAF
jgi:glycosyltransferase involved in cell wall biosynthesis